ncbi:unnamed protein product [Caenorhabditis brenneri]
MNSFPLHMLSNNAAKLVLRHMEPQEKLAYSFCSKATKIAVSALNLSSSMIRFDVGEKILVTVQIDRKTQLLISLALDLNLASIPKDLDFDIRVMLSATETGIWSLPKLTNQKILHHLLDIFHHPRLDDLVFYDDAIPFEVFEPISKIVDEVKIRSLTLVWLTDQFRSRAVKTFQNYDELYVRDFHGLEVHNILMQNRRRLVNTHAYGMKIDQILISNFELIQLNFTLFVEKDFNQFLKLWIRGSNPRLNEFYAGGSSVYRPLDAELILKGIRYKRVPLDSEEVHRRKMIGGWEDETELAGGYIIRRFNGNDAVVVIEDDEFTFITDCFSSD